MEEVEEVEIPVNNKDTENIDDLSTEEEKKSSFGLLPKYRPGKIIAYHSFPGRVITKSPFKASTKTSYGIIVFSWQTRKWLLVKRAYTKNFMRIVEGSYRNSELKDVLSGVKTSELQSLHSLSHNSFKFNVMFKTVFPDKTLEELVYSKERFLASCEVIRNFSPLSLQSKSSMWQFPCMETGENDENPTDIALRALKVQAGLEVSHREKSFLGLDPFSKKEIAGGFLDTNESDCRYWLVVYMEEPKIIKEKGGFQVLWTSSSELKEVLDIPERIILKKAKHVIKENLLL